MDDLHIKDQATLVAETVKSFRPAVFYRTLFARHPELEALFSTGMGAQHDRLADALYGLVAQLYVAAQQSGGDVSAAPQASLVLRHALRSLGRRHLQHHGVEAHHYPIVGEALLDSFEPPLSDRHRAAWKAAYGALSKEMLAGAAGAPPAEGCPFSG